MAISKLANNEELNEIVKKTLGIKSNEKIEVLTKKSTVEVSNTITSLHNAFNKIYAHTLNVKNIQVSEEKRLRNIKKEVTMESRASSASLVGGSDINIGNLPDIFKSLTSSIQELNKNLEKLDMSVSPTPDLDDIDDNDKRRRRGRGRGRDGNRGRGFRLPRALTGMGGRAVLGRLGGVALGMGLAWGAGKGIDMAAGASGVGRGVDAAALAEQDDENWNRASTLGKIQSSIPRGIEAVGGFLGFSNMSTQARADRVRGETSYLQRTQGQGGVSTRAAQRQLENAATRVTRQGKALERASPLGSTSFSSRFADFMNQSIANMSRWAMAAARFVSPTTTNVGDNFFDYGDEGAYYGTGSWAEQIGLVQAESGGNLREINSEGYGGRLQFGTARLADAARAGLVPLGTTGADFSRMSAEQQLAVENWHFSDIDRQAERLGINRYIGQTISGVPINQNSIRAMAHLGGIKGVERFVTSGGRHDPADSNGTKLSDYGRRFNRLPTSRGASGRVGRITGLFGMRVHPVSGVRKMHYGIDIAAPTGTPVLAAYAGRVEVASELRGYGNAVYIKHPSGYVTRYAHLSSIGVRVGASVEEGQRIGAVGSTGQSTGPHLHYELVDERGRQVDPIESYRRRPWIVGGQFLPPAPDGTLASASAPRRQPNQAASLPPRTLSPGETLLNSVMDGTTGSPPSSSPLTHGDAFESIQGIRIFR